MSKAAIGKNAETGNSVALDVDALLRTRLLIQASSGKGKSWLLRRLAEQLFGKVQVIILDPEGEFATLREKFDFVLVGKGGETPADIRSAALVAQTLLKLKACAVCDLFEMKPAERAAWVQRFLEAMIDAPKELWHPVVVIVDEAHMFCPEKGAGESEASDAMIALATRGRKRGYCAVWATQRLGKLRKDAAAELNNVLIGGTFIDVDRKRAADTLGFYGAEQHAFFNEIRVMSRGQFYALGPAIGDERVIVEVGDVQTTHPEGGSAKHAAEAPPVPAEIRKLLPKLADLPKAAEEKAKTEAELRAEIRALKAQLKLRPDETKEVRVADQKAIARAVMAATKQYRELLGQDTRAFLDIARAVKDLPAFCNRILLIADRQINAPAPEEITPLPPIVPTGGRTGIATQAVAPSAAHPPSDQFQDSDIHLKAGARRMLVILAQWHPEPKTRDELGALAGFAPEGGTFCEYMRTLQRSGFIHENGTGVAITDEGLAKVVVIPPRPDSTAELMAMWKSKFKAGVGRMLDVLVEAHPHAISKEELGQRSGFTADGGTFGEYLRTLRRARLVEEMHDGGVKAADSLFP